MKELVIKVRPVTEDIMLFLENKGLLNRLLPTKDILSTPENEIGVNRVYQTDPKFGSHMMICVGFNRSLADMAFHSDNEDFILINEGRYQKPLILVIGLHTQQEFQKLVSNQQLTTDDIWALDLVFNDPRLSFFTMNGFTPHCEWTIPGKDPASIFYVTEPDCLDANKIDMGEYKLEIIY
jgi:hypothetical protein